jgi:hypothetical protein
VGGRPSRALGGRANAGLGPLARDPRPEAPRAARPHVGVVPVRPKRQKKRASLGPWMYFWVLPRRRGPGATGDA